MNTRRTPSLSVWSWSLCFVAGCGGAQAAAPGGATGTLPAAEAEVALQPAALPERYEAYVAHLTPMNPALGSAGLSGEARLELRGGELQVYLEAKGLVDGAHMAHVHGFPNQDSLCPELDTDVNGDGVVDYQEMQASLGPAMFALNDSAGLEPGKGRYPTSRTGSLDWRRHLQVSELQAQIAAHGYDHLRLTQRTVVLHGVAENAKLPPTVDAPDGMSVTESVPIACGALLRVE